MSANASITIRRELRPNDASEVAQLHRSVYGPEYGLNEGFVAGVRRNVEAAVEAGWPVDHGAVWLVDGSESRGLVGALALTREQPATLGRVRWFALGPDLRGRGLGRLMLDEAMAEARAQRMQRLELETFSALTAAAHLYRGVGFEVTRSEERHDWGPTITLQYYAVEL